MVLLTPIWPPRSDTPRRAPDEIPRDVQAAAERARAAGEFKYLSQGSMRVGELVMTFTVLTNDGQESVVREALQAIASATHTTS